MTKERFAWCIKTIGWSRHRVASRLGIDVMRPRRWASGETAVPEEVAAWLETLAAVHEKHPLPKGWANAVWSQNERRQAERMEALKNAE